MGVVAEVMAFVRQQRKGAQQHQDAIQNYKIPGLMVRARGLHSYQVRSTRHLGAEVDIPVAEEQAGDNGLEVVAYRMAADCIAVVAQVLVGCSLAVAEEGVASILMEGAVVQRRRVGFEGEEPFHCCSHRIH